MKDKGEKERYIYLTAEFQKITRRDKKAFLQYGTGTKTEIQINGTKQKAQK